MSLAWMDVFLLMIQVYKKQSKINSWSFHTNLFFAWWKARHDAALVIFFPERKTITSDYCGSSDVNGECLAVLCVSAMDPRGFTFLVHRLRFSFYNG